MPFQRSTDGSALPPTFTCSLCQKKKVPAEFSQAQIRKWHNKKRNDRYNEVDSVSIGLTCKAHIPGTSREMRCHGPCDRMLVPDRFSKNQRRNTQEPWCIDCTEWRLEFEGGEVPTPPPNCYIAPCEVDGLETGEETDFQQHTFTDNFRTADGYNNEDEESDEISSDDDDDYEVYGDSTKIADLADRIMSYNSLTPGDDFATDAASDTDSLYNSLSTFEYQEDSSAARSDCGPDGSTKTPAHGQLNATQPHGARDGDSQASSISTLRGSPPCTRESTSSNNSGQTAWMTATSANIPSHSRGLASQYVGDCQFHGTHAYEATQVSRGFGSGGPSSFTGGSREGIQSFSSRSATALSENQTPAGAAQSSTKAAIFAAARPAGPAPNRFKKNPKWYKGDNRKVFPVKKSKFAARAQDRTEVPHDSDSPDEM
ncbi:hypothetical protein F5Y19DRAFT_202970 [Xylariaceae sp. FL1651]|nr:hypothetical protein F5Y19DRAFT_202970 [Xylariaceae sp. FL1651]